MKYITRLIPALFLLALFATSAVAASENGAENPRAQVEQLTKSWIQLWNGDYSKAEAIVADDIKVHVVLLDGGDPNRIKKAAGVVEWIKELRSAVPDLKFVVEVGPIIDGDHAVIRWIATGNYGGGFPGATAPTGSPVAFHGTDILRTKNGKIVDYWLNAETGMLLQQLQVKTGI